MAADAVGVREPGDHWRDIRRRWPLPDLCERLRWGASETDRRTAIAELLTRPGAIGAAHLIRPAGRKDVWEEAVDVIEALGEAWIEAHLPALLEWLQDLNWPGAGRVLGVVARLEPARLDGPLRAALDRAEAARDEEWRDALLLLRERAARAAPPPRRAP